MASCPKCGRQKVGKDIEKRRRCRQCGILPGQTGMDRSGNARPTDETPSIQCQEAHS